MKTITQANLVRGVNAVTGKATVVQGSVRRISNFVFTRRGSLTTVDGTKAITTGTGINNLWGSNGSGDAVAGPAAMIAATAGGAPSFPVALVLSNFYAGAGNPSPILVDLSQSPAPVIPLMVPGGSSISNQWGGPGYQMPSVSGLLPQLVNVLGQVVGCISNGAAPLTANLFNRTSTLLGSNSPFPPVGAAHGCFHQGALWIFNTAPIDGANGGIDGPSTLRMCQFDALGNPDLTTFPTLNLAYLDRNDGTQGRGLISFTSAEAGIAPTATLVLFKDFSTYQATGLLQTGGSFALTRAQTDMGCVAPRSIQFAPGFGIIRLTHFGVSVFDGANDKLVSEEVRPYLFQTENDIQAMDWGRSDQCYACVSINPPMYCLGVPMPSIGGLSRILCYDLVLKQWTVIDLLAPSTTNPGPIRVMTTMKIGGKKPQVYISDWQPLWTDFATQLSAGYVRKWLDGDPSWDGVPVSWMLKPPPVFSDNPSKPFYARRANFRAKTSSQTVSGEFDMDNVQNRRAVVKSAFSYLDAESLYDSSAKYDSSALYDYPYPDLTIPFDVGAKVWSVAGKFTGQGPTEVIGVDWDTESKPSMPRPRVS